MYDARRRLLSRVVIGVRPRGSVYAGQPDFVCTNGETYEGFSLRGLDWTAI